MANGDQYLFKTVCPAVIDTRVFDRIHIRGLEL